MSTETALRADGEPVTTTDGEARDPALLEGSWSLSPAVALRPEPFGALAYHFGNRRLTFLKSHALVSVVRRLAAAPDIRTALRDANVPAAQWKSYLAALENLAAADMIRPDGALGRTDSTGAER